MQTTSSQSKEVEGRRMFLYICQEVKITLMCKGIDTLKIIYILYIHIYIHVYIINVSHERRDKILHQNIKKSIQWKEIKANWGFNTMHSTFKANGEGGRGLVGKCLLYGCEDYSSDPLHINFMAVNEVERRGFK